MSLLPACRSDLFRKTWILARRNFQVSLFAVLSGPLVVGCAIAPTEPEPGHGTDSPQGSGGGTITDSGSGGSGGTAAATGGVVGAGGTTINPPGGTGGVPLCPYFDPNCNDPDPDLPADDDFELIWQDDFDSFDTNRWRRHDHTFPENASYFSHDNVSVENGKLILRLTQKGNYDPGNPDDRPYLGAEVSTAELFQYVRITGRIKFAKGQGVISSLFTYADDAGYFWNEIDVEFLGYNAQSVQYNLITSKCLGCGLDRNYQPYSDMLGVYPYEDFYTYEITWVPGSVSFRVDNLPRWKQAIDNMNVATRIRMNVWPTSGLDPFAGTLDPGAIPTQAEYDWIRVEKYVGN